MIQYCPEHHNDILASICTAKHNCNVKLCATCLYINHNGTETFPFEIFRTNCTNKFSQLINEMSKITYQKQKTEIKEMIGNIEQQFKNFINGLKQVESIFTQLDTQYEQYKEWNQQLQNHQIGEFSKDELLKIIPLFQKDTSDLVLERKNNIEKAQKLKENFKNKYEKFEQEINKGINQPNQPDAKKQKKIKNQQEIQSNNRNNESIFEDILKIFK